MTAPSDRVTLRYLPAFHCLAGDCKENCCAGLRVQLTEANHARLVAKAAGTELEARVEQLIRLESPAARTARAHAFIDAAGKPCPFLAPDWLCEVHRTLGEDALPDPCSLFPRVLADVEGRRELSATLACPEIARLCLTTEGAVDVVPFDEATMAREIVVRRHDEASPDPYVASFSIVRRAFLEVMNDEGTNAITGLLLLADFAERVAPFFHAGTTSFTAGALDRALADLRARRANDDLVARTETAGARAVHALLEILVARLPNCDNRRFHELIRPLVLRDPAAPNDAIVAYFHGNTAVAVDAAALRDRSARAHARFTPELAARFDAFARRYVVNAIMKDGYVGRTTLSSTLRRLVVRLALSRFTTLLHPTLAGDDPWTIDALDQAAVDAFQIIAKNVEHTPSFMDICESYLASVAFDSPASLASLLLA